MAAQQQKSKRIIYKVDAEKRKRFQEPLFKKVITYEVDQAEAEKFLKRNGRLPEHVYAVEVDDGKE